MHKKCERKIMHNNLIKTCFHINLSRAWISEILNTIFTAEVLLTINWSTNIHVIHQPSLTLDVNKPYSSVEQTFSKWVQGHVHRTQRQSVQSEYLMERNILSTSEHSKAHQVKYNQLVVLTVNVTHLQLNPCLSIFPHVMCLGDLIIIISLLQ